MEASTVAARTFDWKKSPQAVFEHMMSVEDLIEIIAKKAQWCVLFNEICVAVTI